VLSRRAFGVLAVSGGALLARRGGAQTLVPSVETKAQQALFELARWVREKNARLSALIVHVHSGREIARAFPDQALNPASNQKLLTAAAALDALGPEHRFTSLLAGRDTAGALSELVLRSDGDPELSTEAISSLADSVGYRGYRQVDMLLVDQSAFDTRWDPPGYELRPNDWAAYRAPVSAVAVDRNSITLHVAPETAGKPARVWFEPPGLVAIQGRVMTSRVGSALNVRLTVRPRGDKLEASLGGNAPAGGAALSFTRRIAAPELAGGHVLGECLGTRGIRVSAGPRAGGANVTAVLASRRSRPLAQIIHALGKTSDNFTAEMLVKALGAKTSGGPGTAAAGLAAIEQYLGRLGGVGQGTRVGNGSGLFDANRVSARTLVRVLTAAHADPRIGPEFLASLAIGGVDGTLGLRFRALRAERRIRAKTGTLNDVVALSGFVLSPPPLEPIAFSLIVNDVAGKQGEARQRIDKVIEAIAAR
jgi:serine-type D-Ala-D-Ala carboxypeptidase/endopeptidase (penicillin-binding protein 4)